MNGTLRMRQCGWAIVIFVASLAFPGSAHADRMSRLIEILQSDSSYKVRMQAAITLGRLRDARAIPALSEALRDREQSVRAVAAAALAQIGDQSAMPALKERLSQEKSALPVRQIRKAIAHLEDLKRNEWDRRIAIFVRPGNNAAGSSFDHLAPALSDGLFSAFTGEKNYFVYREETARQSPDAPRRPRAVYVLDGNIERLNEIHDSGGLQLACKVRVILSTYPQNSMKAFYVGEARTQVGSRVSTKERDLIYRDLLGSAATGATQHLIQNFLNGQQQ